MNELLTLILFMFLYILIGATIASLLKTLVGKRFRDTDCVAIGAMFPVLLPIVLLVILFVFIEEMISNLLEKLK